LASFPCLPGKDKKSKLTLQDLHGILLHQYLSHFRKELNMLKLSFALLFMIVFSCFNLPLQAETVLPSGCSVESSNNVKDVINSLMDEDKLELAAKLMKAYEEMLPGSKELLWMQVRLTTQQGELEKASAKALSIPPEMQTGSAPIIEAARRQILSGHILKGVDFLTLIEPNEPEFKDIPCQMESMANLLEIRQQPKEAMTLRQTLIQKYPHCTNIKKRLEEIAAQNALLTADKNKNSKKTEPETNMLGNCQHNGAGHQLNFVILLVCLAFIASRKYFGTNS